MGLLSLLQKDPALFAVVAVLLLYSVIAHEVAHGWVAGLFGDDTARWHGRITLNPASHIDPVGVLMLFLAGFGWAKPVPVSYARLRHSRVGLLAVSFAGIVVNILIASAAVLLLQADGVRSSRLLATPLAVAVKINIALAAFNLIPIPPLDGSKIVGELLPEGPRSVYLKLERFGFLILIALLVTRVLDPVIRFIEKGLYTGILWALSLLS